MFEERENKSEEEKQRVGGCERASHCPVIAY